MRNKRGGIGIILFFVAIILILIIGFILSVGIGILNYAGDVITPELESLGSVNISETASANFSAASSYSFGVLDDFNQNLGWVFGFVYVVALIFTIGFVISYESNPNPVWIGLYFMFMLLIILGSIILSNMYQNLYEGNDDIGTRLKEQTLLSWMILYSPLVLSVIMVIAGVYLFARPQEASGGFGI